MKRQFRPTSLNNAPRKTLAISRFNGVDLTTPKFLIENGKAVDSLNYIYKDNVLQKRNGFTELSKIKPFRYVKMPFDGNLTINKVVENDTNFNGIWSFIAEDKKRHVIAHIGKLLYELKDNKWTPLYFSNKPVVGDDNLNHFLCYEYENYESTAFVGDYKLWFLGGNKFMCIRFYFGNVNNQNEIVTSVEPVEDSDLAFVPTTTMSITYNDSKVSNRQELDKVNLLTMYRKNKLISGTFKKDTLKTESNYYEYPLDSPIKAKNENGKIDMANFRMIIEERGVIENGK